jgi:hypothetical protein
MVICNDIWYLFTLVKEIIVDFGHDNVSGMLYENHRNLSRDQWYIFWGTEIIVKYSIIEIKISLQLKYLTINAPYTKEKSLIQNSVIIGVVCISIFMFHYATYSKWLN